MTLNQVLAGNTIDADDIQDELDYLESFAVPISAMKASDTGPRVNATKSADPDLTVTLPANRTYEVDGWLIPTSAANAAGDFAFDWTWTNTATVTAVGLGAHNSLAAGTQAADTEVIAYLADSATPSGNQPYGASTGNGGIHVAAIVVTGSSDVALTVEWAENAINASGTTLRAGSWITARRKA